MPIAATCVAAVRTGGVRGGVHELVLREREEMLEAEEGKIRLRAPEEETDIGGLFAEDVSVEEKLLLGELERQDVVE